MEKFRKVNIVKIGNSIVIINEYRTITPSRGESYEIVNWISFDSSNVSGSTKLWFLMKYKL